MVTYRKNFRALALTISKIQQLDPLTSMKWLENREDGSRIFRLRNRQHGSDILRLQNHQFPCFFVMPTKHLALFSIYIPTKNPLLNRQMINLLSLAYAEYS